MQISHENLTSNCRSIAKAGFCANGGVHVSWMPHYHDMGLVGSILSPIYCGVESVLMSPQHFALKPLNWLQAVDCFKAASSGGPSFAYALAVQKTTAAEREKLDLSSWEVAYCGAEPISEPALQGFAKAFSTAGFNESAFLSCYGMAEATLFVSGRQGLRSVSRAPENGAGSSTRDNGKDTGNNLVSVGQQFGDTLIKVVDAETQVE